jgi:cytochrome P450
MGPPDAFDAARFSPTSNNNRAVYLTFGAGPRLCIAAQFALTGITTVVAELLRAFRFSPSNPEPIVSLSVNTHSVTTPHD